MQNAAETYLMEVDATVERSVSSVAHKSTLQGNKGGCQCQPGDAEVDSDDEFFGHQEDDAATNETKGVTRKL